MSNFRIFIPITKVDKDRRTVGGWATTEKLDKQNEIVDYDASKKAFEDWSGNIREMHEPKAVGKAIDIQHDDDNKRIYVTAKISKGAQDTWEKVKDGTLTGFSIGGQTIDKINQIIKDDEESKQVTRITKYKLNELSLVDNPANPEAQFELVKNVGGQLLQTKVIEDEAPKKITTKYNGGEFDKMRLSKETLTKLGTLTETIKRIVKQDWEDPNSEVGSAKKTPNQTVEGVQVAKQGGDWEDPNPEVNDSKKTPNQTTEGKEVDEGERVGKADMDTNPDSDLQTQEEDGSDAAPVTKLFKQNDDGEYEEVTPEEAKKVLKADMDTNPDSDLQTQEEDGSDAAPVTKRRYRKQYDEDEEMDKGEHDKEEEEEPTTKTRKRHEDEEDKDVEKAEHGDENEEETMKTRKRHKRYSRKQYDEDGEMDKAEDEEDKEKVSKTVLSELQKISKRLDTIENAPLPRKYHKVEKGGDSDESEADVIAKATDEVKKATEEARVTGRPCSPAIETKRAWILDKMLSGKFGSSEMRKV